MHKLETVGNPAIICPSTSRLPCTLDSQRSTACLTTKLTSSSFPLLAFVLSSLYDNLRHNYSLSCSICLLQHWYFLCSHSCGMKQVITDWTCQRRLRYSRLQNAVRLPVLPSLLVTGVMKVSRMTWTHYVIDSLSSHAGVANKSEFFQCCLSLCKYWQTLQCMHSARNTCACTETSQYSLFTVGMYTHDGHFLCCSRLPEYTSFLI